MSYSPDVPRSDGRFLTTHAGSLPRSERLVALHASRARGEPVDPDAFADAIDESTAAVVRLQAECGVDVGNDGEQARESFFTYVRHRLTGFGDSWMRPIMADIERFPGWAVLRAEELAKRSVSLMQLPVCVGDVRSLGTGEVAAECEVFRRALAAGSFADVFMTAASPGIVALAMENRHYDDLATYVGALADAMRPEYEYIAEQGFVLQIDAPDLAMERHVTYAGRTIDEFRSFVRLVVDNLGRVLSNVPRERIRLHVCWGNYDGPHTSDVPLADILPELYRANVGALVLSMANPRHAHEWRVFADMPPPDHLTLIAGVVDTTTNYVEHPEVVAERIERIATIIGDPTRVLAGTDCGFDTAAGFRTIAPDICWEKLRTLHAGAAIASARVFG
jgi:5-methyltetrahydropteroyltriglutamate--homocysteine methyltransferase